jgi:hypothetical protein
MRQLSFLVESYPVFLPLASRDSAGVKLFGWLPRSLSVRSGFSFSTAWARAGGLKS